MRCAQRGCKLPNDATTAEGAVCPVCNNPLIVVIEPEDAAEFSGEVSQEKPPVIGEDGPLLAVAVDDDEKADALRAAHPGGEFDNGVNPHTGN